VFHIEMRKFPHNTCVFNLSEDELRQLIVPWLQEKWIEVGERKWNPNEARMTVLEGPHLEVEDLAIGRGWRNAQHQSQDVTELVMAQVQASLEGSSSAATAAPMPAASVASGDPLGASDSSTGSLDARLQSLLGPTPVSLLQAWELTAQRRPELSPSESLALAESTLRSLDADS
jgi:hypothetical protein